MLKSYVAGVDLGGTKIAASVCDLNGDILGRAVLPTEAIHGREHVVQNIKNAIYRALENAGAEVSQLKALGVSAPGPLSVSQGMILYIATLDWRNVPIREILRQIFHIPVFLENDCNAAAWGELKRGAGKGSRNMVYVTMSTGVGSGIIINGKIYHGRHDSSGELGHICVELHGRDCRCGNKGCLQAYASGTSIAEIARETLPDSSLLYEMSGHNLNSIDAIMVAEAAKKGDDFALRIWETAGTRLGQGISILKQLFDADAIIIGGSVTKSWELFYKPMMNTIQNHTYKLIYDDCKISKAALDGDSGTIGAAMIALENMQ